MSNTEIQKCRRYRAEAVAAGRVNARQFDEIVCILRREGWNGDMMGWGSAALVARNTATAHLRVTLNGIPELLRRVGVTA